MYSETYGLLSNTKVIPTICLTLPYRKTFVKYFLNYSLSMYMPIAALALKRPEILKNGYDIIFSLVVEVI